MAILKDIKRDYLANKLTYSFMFLPVTIPQILRLHSNVAVLFVGIQLFKTRKFTPLLLLRGLQQRYGVIGRLAANIH